MVTTERPKDNKTENEENENKNKNKEMIEEKNKLHYKLSSIVKI